MRPQPTTDQTITFHAADGQPLGGTIYAPTGSQGPSARLLINSGTAISQTFYGRMARWLASQGVITMTYDYRGVGESRPRKMPMRRFKARAADWGKQDYPAALAALQAQSAHLELPTFVLGHSFGGQIMGMTPATEQARGLIMVASQSGYWGHWSGMGRAQMAAWWHLIVPSLAGPLGYLPGGAGLGADIPGQMALQWARWGRHRDYLLSDPELDAKRQFAALRMPKLAYTFTDDRLAPPKAVDALLSWLPQASLERRVVHPHELGRKEIGHFNFFRPAFKDPLWAEVLDFIQEHRRPDSLPIPQTPNIVYGKAA